MLALKVHFYEDHIQYALNFERVSYAAVHHSLSYVHDS